MITFSRVTIFGLVLNVVLAATLFFFWWNASSPDAQPLPRSAVKFRVAIVRWDLSDGVTKMAQGVVEALSPFAEVVHLHANGDRIQLHAVIEKAVGENIDAFVTIGTAATQMAKEVTKKRQREDIPVIFCGTGDPLKAGLVPHLENHGGNVTGFCISGFGFVKPMIEQLPLFAPHVKKILIPYDPTALGGTLEEYRQYMGAQLEERGYEVRDVKVYQTNDVAEKVQSFIADCDMVWLLPDITVLEAMESIGKLCEQYKKFSYVTMNLMHLEKGAALAFGYEVHEMGVDAGNYVKQILVDGKRPHDLPVLPLQPSRFRVGINISNARKQGLLEQVDPTLLYLMQHSIVFE